MGARALEGDKLRTLPSSSPSVHVPPPSDGGCQQATMILRLDGFTATPTFHLSWRFSFAHLVLIDTMILGVSSVCLLPRLGT